MTFISIYIYSIKSILIIQIYIHIITNDKQQFLLIEKMGESTKRQSAWKLTGKRFGDSDLQRIPGFIRMSRTKNKWLARA